MSGAIAERWFFERLVNMTYSPKNKVQYSDGNGDGADQNDNPSVHNHSGSLNTLSTELRRAKRGFLYNHDSSQFD